MKLAYTGHRPEKVGGYDENHPQNLWVKEQLVKSLAFYQPTLVIVGGALGVDTWAAEAALEAGIPYALYIPFEGFEKRWPRASQERFLYLWEKAVSQHIVCLSPSTAAYQKRNEAMVNRCSQLVAIWDGSPGGTGNCVRYAQAVRCPIRRVDPSKWESH